MEVASLLGLLDDAVAWVPRAIVEASALRRM
jgi:hypothetical protein